MTARSHSRSRRRRRARDLKRRYALERAKAARAGGKSHNRPPNPRRK